MNILILGGTGAMGGHLTEILSKNTGNKIFITTRKNRNSQKDVISYITGNAKENSFLDSILALQNWNVIVDFMSYNTIEFSMRVEKLLASCEQYIFLSSARVYADSKTPITENSPRLLDVCDDKTYLATDEYALAKARQENFLFSTDKKNWTVIRPYITYSENRLQLGVLEKECWLYSAINCGVLVFSKDIEEHFTTLTYGYDVARGISALIGNQKAYGEVFNITGNKTIKWQQVFQLYSKILKANNINFDEIIKEKTYRFYDTQNYKVIYDRYYNRTFDNSKISEFIDINSFLLPEVGLEKCLMTFLQNPQFDYIDIRGIVKILRGTSKKLPLKKIKGAKNISKYVLTKLHFL